MLGCQPVVDGHDHGIGADGVLAAGAVVGVEVAGDEAAAVKEHNHRRRFEVSVIGSRPIDSNVDRAGRPIDAAVFHPQLGIKLAPRQIPQLPAGRVDAVVDG